EGVDRLCEELFLTLRAQSQDDNLLFVRDRLRRGGEDPAAVLDLYAQVRRGRRVSMDDTNPLVSVLRLSGIIRVVESRLRGLLRGFGVPTSHLAVRNRIYERVFDLHWVERNMPDAELRRQRAA